MWTRLQAGSDWRSARTRTVPERLSSSPGKPPPASVLRFSARADAEGVPLEFAFLIAREAVHGHEVVIRRRSARKPDADDLPGQRWCRRGHGCRSAGCGWTAVTNATWITITG